MPFGPDCEYKDMDACVAAHSDKDDPEAYCAEIMRQTEEHCRSKNSEPVCEIRSFPFDLASIEVRQEDEKPHSVSWYAALFDSLSDDLGGFRERIGRRAFTKSLQEREVRALINHDPNMILGRTSKDTLKVHVDLRGLRAESSIPETSYASDLIVNIENGNIGGGSFMFATQRESWDMEEIEEQEILVRTIHEARLYDVSLVTFPAYPATEGTTALRSVAEEWRQKLIKVEPSIVIPNYGKYRRRLNLLRLKQEGKN